jgi:hypothetical protein
LIWNPSAKVDSEYSLKIWSKYSRCKNICGLSPEIPVIMRKNERYSDTTQ